MSIFISTGEISGDIYAAKISKALSVQLPHEELWGMAGALADGINRVWNNDQLHIVGLGRIVKSLPALFRLRNELASAVVKRQPHAVIVVDSPDFHIPLLAKIRKLGYKGPVIYVCPPTIWAWRSGRAKYLKKYCDLCLPLFQFEEKALEARNVKSYWCGHPLIDDFLHYRPTTGVEYDPKRIALLPGSRRSEIRTLLPILEEVALELRNIGYKPVFSIAPGLDFESTKMVEKNSADIESTTISGRDLMSASRMVIGASGTAAVEAMLLDRFMVVLYRGSTIEWNIYKLLTHTDYVSIPNVLAGKFVYPELLQNNANCKNIINCALHYLDDENYAKYVHSVLLSDREKMGESGAVNRWATAIANLVKA